MGNNISPLFSSLNGSYNAAANMSSVISQRSQIQNGSYGKLMKAYVKKVGNKTALNAYRSTGTTANSASDLAPSKTESESASVSSIKKRTPQKSSFLDNHLSSIGKAQTSRATASGKSYLDTYLKEKAEPEMTGVAKAKAHAEAVTGRKLNEDGTTSVITEDTGDTGVQATTTVAETSSDTKEADKYAGMKSSWLDDHLKSYDQEAKVQTAADNSVAVDETV